MWLTFTNAIIVWRRQKVSLFSDPSGGFSGPKALRKELAIDGTVGRSDFPSIIPAR